MYVRLSSENALFQSTECKQQYFRVFTDGLSSSNLFFNLDSIIHRYC